MYDEEEQCLFLKSTKLNVAHRRCVTKERLIELIIEGYARDYRQANSIYKMLRCVTYPIVRETVAVLFKKNVMCSECLRQAPLPKTTLHRRTILATYLNSRWQMDLKKLPTCRGYEYACNVVDCFSA